MRTTVTIDDELLAKARRYTDIEGTSALVQLALKRYVETEASRRLARMGGTQPQLKVPPRRGPLR
ncbi:MAG: type II toxin-antitoxin system VapB family antitoxin [Terriglobales bacterium]